MNQLMSFLYDGLNGINQDVSQLTRIDATSNNLLASTQAMSDEVATQLFVRSRGRVADKQQGPQDCRMGGGHRICLHGNELRQRLVPLPASKQLKDKRGTEIFNLSEPQNDALGIR